MLKLTGLVLLIYGILGVLGAVFAYLALRGPAQRLRELFALLAQQFEQSSTAVKRVSDWVFKESPLLQKIAEFTGQIDKVMHETGKRFGEAAQSLKNLEAGLDAVKVPTLNFQTQSLDLDFGATVVESVSLKEYKIDLVPGPGGEMTLYGPPLTVETTTVGLDLGQVTVVTGVNVTDGYPLQPIGDAFRFVGDKFEDAKQQITQAADRFNDVKTRTLEMKENLEKSIEGLKDFIERLKGVGVHLQEVSSVKLISLLPLVAAGFFVFIHVAFALAGYALLTM